MIEGKLVELQLEWGWIGLILRLVESLGNVRDHELRTPKGPGLLSVSSSVSGLELCVVFNLQISINAG